MMARRNLVLLALVTALLLVVGVAGWLSWQTDRQREREAEEQRRYGEVLAAAAAHADAVVNLRHDDPASFEAAQTGATEELRQDYEPEGDVVAPLRRDRTVLEGEVTWAGVAALAGDEAAALVATTGTLASRNTDGEPVERLLRLRLELERVDGEWLTASVELVG